MVTWPMRVSRFIVPALALSAMLALGCASNRTIPRADYQHGPLPHQHRRLHQWGSMAFWSRLSPDVYDAVESLPRDLSVDQDLTVREFGPPQWEREFKSLDRERVLEWLNIDHGLVFHYIDGELVFQGPIRDIEHVMLRHGQPNRVLQSMTTAQVERVTFVYSRVFSLAREYHSFANGALVTEDYHP